MSRLRAAPCWLLVCCGLAFAQGGNFTIHVDPEMRFAEDSPAGNAWLTFAAQQIVKWKELQDRQPLENRGVDDYEIERHARQALARFWAEQRASGAAAEPYLDTLVAIDEAGFIDEYVLWTFGKPGWTVSAPVLAELRMEAFGAWARERKLDIATPTYAYAEPDPVPPPLAEPGASLPDPAPYAPDRTLCRISLEPLRNAMEAWQREAALLGGAPLAAMNTRHFIGLVQTLAEQEPFRGNGVTWVTLAPAELSYYAGYCAVDTKDFTAGETWLRQAVVMLPFDSTARLELVHALIGEGKLDEADEHVAWTLANTEDRCALALAWRRRGYIRFEQSRWIEARSAYERSLEFEPGNRLALSELELIEPKIAAGGGARSTFEPSEQYVTRCAE